MVLLFVQLDWFVEVVEYPVNTAANVTRFGERLKLLFELPFTAANDRRKPIVPSLRPPPSSNCVNGLVPEGEKGSAAQA